MNTFQKALETNKKTKSVGAKKKTMPTVEFSDKEMNTAVSEFLKSRQVEKEAKAEKEFHSNFIVEKVRTIQDENAFNGEFSKSYEVKTSVGSVKFVMADKFSVNPNDEEEIRNILGNEFNSLMEEKVEVKLKESVMNNTELQKKLMKLIGNNFDEFFEVTSTLTTKEGFDEKVYEKVDKSKMDELRTYVKQSKPSIR